MKNNSGFTLMEILMVVVLVGIVALVAIPSFIDFGTEAKTALTQDKLISIKKAIVGDPTIVSDGKVIALGFYSHMGAYPTTLNSLVTKGIQPNYDPFTKTGWRGPYLDSSSSDWNQDSWGTLIVYSQVGRTITSCGKDTVCGNGDDIQLSF